MDTATTEYVTIPEAARRLGLSRSAVRRRLTAGRLRGRQEQRPQGLLWLVALPTEAGGTSRHVAPPPDTSRDVPDGDTSRDVAPPEAPGAPTMALQSARAAEMATYSRELLSPLLGRLEQQATALGRLEQENEHLRAALAAAQTPSAPPAGGQAGRSWWRRWFG